VAAARPARPPAEHGTRVRWGRRVAWLAALVAPTVGQQRGAATLVILALLGGLAVWLYGED
jgi:hypothetical protein